jgi:hypothetical protein
MQVEVAAVDVIRSSSSVGVPAYACVFAKRTSFNDNGDLIAAGDPSKMTGGYYRRVAVTNAGNVTTIPAFTGANKLDVTYDSATGRNENEYVLGLYTSTGRQVQLLFDNVTVPDTPASTSWEELVLFTNATSQPMKRDYYDKYEINRLLDLVDPDTNWGEILGDINDQTDLITMLSGILGGYTKQLTDYADLAAAVTAIGATPTVLAINKNTTVSTAITIPATLLLLQVPGYLITKGVGGSITFLGEGLIYPEAASPLFSGFTISYSHLSNVNYQDPASAKIRFTGTTFPKRLSANLWNNAWGHDRAMNAIEALSGKTATVAVHPSDYEHKFYLREGLSLHMLEGNHNSMIFDWHVSGDNAVIIMEDDTTIYGDGQGKTIFNESPTNQKFIYSSGMEFPSAPFQNYNQHIRDISFIGNPVCPFESSSSTILIGNINRGSVRHCDFKEVHGFAVYVGGFTDAPGLPSGDGVWVTDCYAEGLGTQYMGTIGGQNVYIDRNIFIVSNPNGSVFSAVIDIEPNAATHGSDNIHITNNLFDGRKAQLGFNAITVQRAYSGAVRNARISGNTILAIDGSLGQMRGSTDVNIATNTFTLYNHGYLTGQTVQFQASVLPGGVLGGPITGYGYIIADTLHTFRIAANWADAYAGIAIDITSTGSDDITVTGIGYMAIGIQIYTVQEAIVENNYVKGAGQFGIDCGGCYKPTIANNTLVANSSGLRMSGVIDGIVKGNVVSTLPIALSQGNEFTEQEAEFLVATTAGSPIIQVLVSTPIPWFYVGKTVTIDGITYTIFERTSDFTGQGLKLSANVPTTNASILGTFNFSSNTYIGNKVDRMILMPGSRVVSAADRVVSQSYTPAQITANQNNYNPGNGARRFNLSSNASRNITGIDLDQTPLLLTHLDGQQHFLYNAGSFDIVLKHQDAASSAENRLLCSTGADITLAAGEAADIEYSTTLLRWIVFKRGGGSAGIGGTAGTTDNAIPRADGVGGFTLQGSLASIDDAGYLVPKTAAAFNVPNIYSDGDPNTGMALFGSDSINFINGGNSNFGLALGEINVGSAFKYGWSSGGSAFASGLDTALERAAAKFVKVTDGSTGGGGFEFTEMAAPGAPAANKAYFYADDNGAGKTRIMARFATGAAVQVAIEP